MRNSLLSGARLFSADSADTVRHGPDEGAHSQMVDGFVAVLVNP